MSGRPFSGVIAELLGLHTVHRVFDDKINVKEAAVLLDCSTDTVYLMINQGILPAYRPSPRRTWLRRSEVEAAMAVRLVVNREPAPRIVDRQPPAEPEPIKPPRRRKARKPTWEEELAALDPYADLRQAS